MMSGPLEFVGGPWDGRQWHVQDCPMPGETLRFPFLDDQPTVYLPGDEEPRMYKNYVYKRTYGNELVYIGTE